jgi:uncharacterized protein (TIGR03663 family)
MGQREESSSWLTLEHAGYTAIGLLAAGLRLLHLGLRPLSEGEAVQALAALEFTQGAVPVAPSGTIPALFTSNTLAFSLLGAGDITARWLPVLAGVILALLPYGMRHRLGRGGALVAALLLALSSSAVYFSRMLDGAVVVAACGLALAVGLIRFIDMRRPRALYLAAAALGLGLLAGPGIWTLLVIFAAFVLVLYLAERLLDSESGWSALMEAWSSLREEKSDPDSGEQRGLSPLARTGIVLAAVFGLGATTLVLQPAGVGHAADLIGAWARDFSPQPGGQYLAYPLLLLLRYEPLILFLGLVELGQWLVAGRSQRNHVALLGPSFPHTAFLVFWAVAATLIILIAGHRAPGNLFLVVVPLALLAGQGVERTCRWLTRQYLWAEAGAVAAVAAGLGAFLYLQLASYARASSASTISIASITLSASTTYLILALVALLLLLALGVVAWFWRGPKLVASGGWLAAVFLFGLFGFRAMWGLNFAHANDPRQLMIQQATSPGVRAFAKQLEALSLEKAGDAHTLPVTVDANTGPVVAWYLREFDQKTVVEGLSAPPGTVAVVTLAAQNLPIGETYRGQSFPLRARWLPEGLGGQELLRWLLFLDGDLPAVDRQVVLWVGVQ